MSKDPKRMSEEPTLLGESVKAVRRGLPPDDRLAALAARLSAAGAAVEFEPVHETPSANEPPQTSVARATSPWHPRLLALGALAVGVGFVAWGLTERTGYAPHSEGAAKPANVAIAPSLPSPPRAEPPAEPHAGNAVEPLRREPLAEPNLAAPPTALPNGSAPPSPASAAALAVAPNTPSRAEPSPSNASPNAASSPPPNDDRSPTARRVTRTSSSTPGGSNDTHEGAPLAANTVVQSELELLKLARSTVAADPAQAYALTERCRAQYPSGDLAQEREYIAISALVRLGRSSEASSRAALFRMHYPSSAYLPRLSHLLGDR